MAKISRDTRDWILYMASKLPLRATGNVSFRRLAVIRYRKIAPRFGSDLVDSIEASPAHPALEALAPPGASQNRRNRVAAGKAAVQRVKVPPCQLPDSGT